MARTVGSTAEATRQRMLDAALDLFTERGYAGTPVRDVAQRLGMSKASLYYHFGSKEDLLHALVEPVIEELNSCARAAEAGSAAPGTLIRRLIDLFDDHRHVMKGTLYDASARRVLIERHHMFEGLGRLERALAGSAESADLVRARCAVGAIRGAVVSTDDIDSIALNKPPDSRGAVRSQLSESDRQAVTVAVLAVLDSG